MNDRLETIIWSILILIFFLMIFSLMLVIIDGFTREFIGTEQVKCIDDTSAEFVDELCEKEIHCSWLGIASNGRCKDFGK